MKIFGKLLTLVGGSIVCLVVSFCLAGTYILSDFATEMAEKRVASAAGAMRAEFDGDMDMQNVLCEMFAQDGDIVKAVAEKNGAAIRAASKDIMSRYKMDFVTVCDADGKVLARGHSDKAGDNLGPGRISAVVPLRDGKNISGIEPGNVVKLTLAAGSPVKHGGKVVGAVIMGQDLSSGRFVNDVKHNLGVECTIFVDDVRLATTVMRDGKPVVGTPLNNQEIYNNVVRGGKTVITKNMIAGKEYDTAYWPWKDMTGKIGGLLFVGMSRDDIVVSQKRVILFFSLTGLILGAALMGVGVLMARAIVRPLQAATTYAETVASGDFHSTIEVTSKDEVGQLTGSLKSMVGQLKERLGFAQGIMRGIVAPFVVADTSGKFTYLNQQALDYWGLSGAPADFIGRTSGEFFHQNTSSRTLLDEVIADSKPRPGVPVAMDNARGEKKYMRMTAAPLWDMDGNQLGACLLIMDETEINAQQSAIMAMNERISVSVREASKISELQATAFNRLTAQLDKTSIAAHAQDKASENTMAGIAEMSETLEILADKAKKTTDDTMATRIEAEDGDRVVGETLNCIRQMAEYAGNTERGIEALGQRAAGITNIVELIKDVADQTNLLALNAAIEAARAGDAGRGFAVVADEVRKLAEKTMQATSEVNSSVSELQAEVKHTMELTSETVRLSNTSTELAGKSGESLKRIVAIAQHAVGEVSAIAGAAAEQSRAGAALSDSMNEISSMARQSVGNMRESNESVSELTALSKQLREVVDSMSSERR